MCGRVIQYKDPSTYGRALDATGSPNSPPRYNGAPGQDLLVVRSNPETGLPEIGVLRWGLIPNWAKDRKIAWKLINARSETIERMPAFRKAYASRRCLIPVDGFYKWRKIGKAKQPYMIAMKDREPFTLARLWENWKDPESGEWSARSRL
jgi:putative SOS response-associated peptidase YedK